MPGPITMASRQSPPPQGFQAGRPTGAPVSAPAKQVYGISLQRLYERDALAVPMVVYQCITAVDLYGLGVEGIYRQSGSLNHINKLKNMFDTGKSHAASGIVITWKGGFEN
jgi:Rho GTPase-activating protein RGD1